jgi:hypothetical protein
VPRRPTGGRRADRPLRAALHRAAVVEQASRSGRMVGLGHAEEIDQIAAALLLALRSGPRPLVDGSAFAGLASLYDQQLWTKTCPTPNAPSKPSPGQRRKKTHDTRPGTT